MNIGEASRATGISVKMIRHYESIGLIPTPLRTGSGYRVYRDPDIRTLQFIRRARDLGFSVEKMERLIALWRNQNRSSAEVKEVALGHVKELESRIVEMEAMLRALRHLATACLGGTEPSCPILDSLMTGEAIVVRKSASSKFDGIAIASRSGRSGLMSESSCRPA